MIKLSTPQDTETIMDIWLRANVIAHPFLSESYWRQNFEKVKVQYLPMAKTKVYVENGEVVGFISVIDQKFIGALFVDPAMQNKGIGSKLIDDAIKTHAQLELAVYTQNNLAVNFYKKHGFKVIKEQLNEESKKPEFIMSKM